MGLFFLSFSLFFLLYVIRSFCFFRVCCELWSGGIVGFCQGLLWIEMGRRSMLHFFHPKTHSSKLFLCFWWLCFRIWTRHLQFFASTSNGQRSMNCQSTYYTPPLVWSSSWFNVLNIHWGFPVNFLAQCCICYQSNSTPATIRIHLKQFDACTPPSQVSFVVEFHWGLRRGDICH